jgi:hypothetical protein
LRSTIATASTTALVTGKAAAIGMIAGGWHISLPLYSLGCVDLGILAAMLPTVSAARLHGAIT